MAPRMTKELRPINHSRDLQFGESFIIYYKNSGIGRKDLWLGIICPESMMPIVLRNKRPPNSRPKDGEWDTPIEDRVHSVYLPGKNNYQWLEKKHLYHVEARPPSLFSDNLRTDCKTFLEVHKLARSRKDADFWFAMAVAERERKGKLGRTPGLVYPAKRPAQPDSMVPNKDARESPKGPEQSPKTEGLGNISAKKMPGVDDEQLNSDMESSDMGTPPKTPNQARSNNMEPEGPPAASDVGSSPETISRKTMPKGFYVYISVGTQTDLESISRHSPNDIIDIYVGSGTDHAVFQLPIKTIEQCQFLQSRFKNDVCYIFHPDLYKLPASEFEPIHSFLVSGDFTPKLVDRSKSINPEEQLHILGDQFGFGQKYTLANIDSSDDLDKQILRFGRIYLNAQVFGLEILQGLALWKIQVAWNSYSGLDHLISVLQVTQMAARKAKDDPESVADSSQDLLQMWMVGFLADTMDFFICKFPEQFWQVMGANNALQVSVLRRRAEKLAKNPDKYINLEEVIASRERG